MSRYRGRVLDQILPWTNRRKLAAELKARGFDRGVSGESLNRWVRDGTELPTKVERELRKILGLPETEEAAPDLPERLNKIEMYLRAIAKAAKVPPAELEKIEEAHRIAQGIAPGRRRSGATRP